MLSRYLNFKFFPYGYTSYHVRKIETKRKSTERKNESFFHYRDKIAIIARFALQKQERKVKSTTKGREKGKNQFRRKRSQKRTEQTLKNHKGCVPGSVHREPCIRSRHFRFYSVLGNWTELISFANVPEAFRAIGKSCLPFQFYDI